METQHVFLDDSPQYCMRTKQNFVFVLHLKGTAVKMVTFLSVNSRHQSDSEHSRPQDCVSNKVVKQILHIIIYVLLSNMFVIYYLCFGLLYHTS